MGDVEMAECDYWGLFNSTPEANCTTEYQYQEYRSDVQTLAVTAVPGRQLVNTLKMVSRDLDSWLIPSRGYVNFIFTIQTIATGEPVNSTVEVAATGGVVTLIGSSASIFRRAELYCNGQLIDYSDYCGIIQTVETLLYDNLDKLKTTGESEWMYLDDYGTRVGIAVQADPETVAPIAASVVEGYGAAEPYNFVTGGTNNYEFFNASYQARWLRSRSVGNLEADRTYVEVALPLRKIFGFCRDVDKAFIGLSWEVRLILESSEYARIMHGKSYLGPLSVTNCQPLVTKCSVWLPAVKPSLLKQAGLTESLSSRMIATHKYDNLDTFVSDVYVGTSSASWTVTSTTARPTKIFLMFQNSGQYGTQDDGAAAGAGTAHDPINNGGNFTQLVDITNVELRINQKVFPRERYQLTNVTSSSSGDKRAYYDFLAASGRNLTDEGILSYKKWKNMYKIFAFDLTQNDDLVFSGIKQNDIVLRWQVNATALTYRAYAVINSEFKIDVQSIDGRIGVQI